MLQFRHFYFIIFVVFSLLTASCSSNSFNISKNNVGKITQQTTVEDLDNLFKNDSIVKKLSEGATGDTYLQDDDEILIFEKGGKHLLTIIPMEPLDATSTIKQVEVHDNRYKTAKNISKNSKYFEVDNAYNINKSETSFASVTLFIDELNATITIDKEALGRKGLITQKIDLEEIPDKSRMKSFIIWFH